MPSYPIKGGVLVPLGEMCRALDFAITVDVASGGASGFFISEKRRFSLDVSGRRVSAEGKERHSTRRASSCTRTTSTWTRASSRSGFPST